LMGYVFDSGRKGAHVNPPSISVFCWRKAIFESNSIINAPAPI
jgi:hypothetical protein